MASQQGKLHNSVEQNLLIFAIVYKQYAIYDLPRVLHSSVIPKPAQGPEHFP